MRTPRIALAVGLSSLLATVALAPASVARAQAPEAPTEPDGTDEVPDDAERDVRAREAFERGVAAYQAGREEAAVSALQESLTLSPRVTTAFNLALALEQLGRDAAAATLAAGLLRGEYGPPDDAQRERVGALLASAESKAARLTVMATGVEDGAWIRIDGGDRTPLRGERLLWLAQGGHEIEVGAPGVASQRTSLALVNGERRRLVFDLRQAPGILVVTGPEDRPIEIVDVLRGRGRIEATLPPGTYQVGLVEGPYRSVVLEPGGSEHISLLDPRPRAAEESGSRRGRRWGIAIGVVAVVGAAVALGFGLSRRSPEVEPDPHLGIFEALSSR